MVFIFEIGGSEFLYLVLNSEKKACGMVAKMLYSAPLSLANDDCILPE